MLESCSTDFHKSNKYILFNFHLQRLESSTELIVNNTNTITKDVNPATTDTVNIPLLTSRKYVLTNNDDSPRQDRLIPSTTPPNILTTKATITSDNLTTSIKTTTILTACNTSNNPTQPFSQKTKSPIIRLPLNLTTTTTTISTHFPTDNLPRDSLSIQQNRHDSSTTASSFSPIPFAFATNNLSSQPLPTTSATSGDVFATDNMSRMPLPLKTKLAVIQQELLQQNESISNSSTVFRTSTSKTPVLENIVMKKTPLSLHPSSTAITSSSGKHSFLGTTSQSTTQSSSIQAPSSTTTTVVSSFGKHSSFLTTQIQSPITIVASSFGKHSFLTTQIQSPITTVAASFGKHYDGTSFPHQNSSYIDISFSTRTTSTSTISSQMPSSSTMPVAKLNSSEDVNNGNSFPHTQPHTNSTPFPSSVTLNSTSLSSLMISSFPMTFHHLTINQHLQQPQQQPQQLHKQPPPYHLQQRPPPPTYKESKQQQQQQQQLQQHEPKQPQPLQNPPINHPTVTTTQTSTTQPIGKFFNV